MNSKKEICIGMAGAGRAMQLHMVALQRYNGVPICYKHIIARRWEQIELAKEKYGFINASLEFEDLLKDDEIDVIDICTPPYAHKEMIIKALQAGKHVICEKPLSGYFGETTDEKPIGLKVSKSKMYDVLLKDIEEIRSEIYKSGKLFMYAENFIYAPAIIKAGEIISKKKSKILYAKGEESLKGSSSPVAGEWNKTGGGTLLRTGAHPLTAILWLKQVEANSRNEEIKVKSVLADVGQVTNTLNEYEHRHISATPNDVEDNATVILTFTDDSKAVITATDTLLGGSKNEVELYCNDGVIECKLTLSNLMKTYFLDEDNLDDIYLSEMLPSKLGWNNLSLEDEFIRGYTNEMADFMECIYYNKQPKSGFDLAYDTIKIIYASYKSAELNKRVEL